MAAIFQTTFSNAFSWMKICEFRLRIHWSLFLKVQSTIFQHWFIYWLGAVQATSHYLNQWWLNYWRIYASLSLNGLTPQCHICASEMSEHWFRKWLVTCSAPSHYLNQCWLIVKWTPENKFQWNSNRNSIIFLQENAFEIVCQNGSNFVLGR